MNYNKPINYLFLMIVFITSCKLMVGQPLLKGKYNIKYLKANKIRLRLEPSQQKPVALILEELKRQKTTKDDYKFRTVGRSKGEWAHYLAQQTHQGIPVEGAEISIHTQNGLCKSLYGRSIDSLSISSVATITENQAVSLALAEVNAGSYAWENTEFMALLSPAKQAAFSYPVPKLTFTSTDLSFERSSYRLAYKITIAALQPLLKTAIYIDAQSGAIIRKEDQTKQCSHTSCLAYESKEQDGCEGEGVGRRLGLVPFPIACGPDNFYLMEDAVIRMKDANFVPGLQLNPVKSFLTDEWPEDAIDVYWGMRKIYDYFYTVHNMNSYDGQGSPIIPVINYQGVDYSNAICMTPLFLFGHNSGNPYTSIEIVAHEYFHAIIEDKTNLAYTGETAAITEGVCDIFGVYLEHYINGTPNMDFEFGNGVLGSPRPFIEPETANLPSSYQGQYWENSHTDESFHINGSVLNHWFYLLHTDSVATADIIDLLINSLDFLPSYADFHDLRQATIDATSGTTLKNKVMAAWDLVNVLDLDSGSIAFTNIPSPDQVLQADTTFTLEWTGTTNCLLEFSTDDGKIWMPIAEIDSSQTYQWQIPSENSEQVRLRISDSANPWVRTEMTYDFSIISCSLDWNWAYDSFFCIGDSLVFEGISPYSVDILYAADTITLAADSLFILSDTGIYNLILYDAVGGCATRSDTFNIEVFGDCDNLPTDKVYPGDSNNNGIVDIEDFLAIIHFYGKTGPARSLDNVWFMPQVAPEDWIEGNNAKYADCNGDGLINGADLAVMKANFGKSWLTTNDAQKTEEKEKYQESPVDVIVNIVPQDSNSTIKLEFNLRHQYSGSISSTAFSGSIKLNSDAGIRSINEIATGIGEGAEIVAIFDSTTQVLHFAFGMANHNDFDLASIPIEAVITVNQLVGSDPTKVSVGPSTAKLKLLTKNGDTFPVKLTESACRYNEDSDEIYCRYAEAVSCNLPGYAYLDLPDSNSVLWENGDTDDTLAVKTPGLYRFTVTDANNAIYTDAIQIGGSKGFELRICQHPVYAPNKQEASVTASIVGGTPPFIYTWNDGQAGSGAILNQGLNQVVVSDATGCSKQMTIEIGNLGRDFVFLRKDVFYATATDSIYGNVLDNDFLYTDNLPIKLIDPDGLVSLDSTGNFSLFSVAGEYSFSYEVCNTFYCDTAIVLLMIVDPSAISLADDYYYIPMNGSCQGNFLSNDYLNANYNFTIKERPKQGNLDATSTGSFNYRPCPNFIGTESFSYTVNLADGSQKEATVFMEFYPISQEQFEECESCSPLGNFLPGDVITSTTDGFLFLIDKVGHILKWDTTAITIAPYSLEAGGYRLMELELPTLAFPAAYLDSLAYFAELLADNEKACLAIGCSEIQIEGCTYSPLAAAKDHFILNTGVTQIVEIAQNSSATIEIITEPTNGDANITSQGISYTPAPSFNGIDYISYKITTQENGLCHYSNARIQIIVTQP